MMAHFRFKILYKAIYFSLETLHERLYIPSEFGILYHGINHTYYSNES